MPIPDQRDPVATRKVLADWLGRRLGDDAGTDVDDVEIGELRIPAGTGFSNETLIFRADWSEGGRRRSDGFVVRVAPSGYKLFLDSDFEHQFRLLDHLDKHTDVPVPPMRWYEEDAGPLGAPFFVMGEVEGRAPTDNPPYNAEGWLAEATDAERATLWDDAMARLVQVHAVDHRPVQEYLAKPALGATGLDQQLAYQRDYLDWATDGETHPIAEPAWQWLQDHRPATSTDGLSWGDSRIGNMLFGPDFRVRAIVDWEQLSLGGPMMDLGWWLFLDRYHSEGCGVPRLGGLGTREQTIETYERLSGRPVQDLAFYEVFAGFRFTVIMKRLSVIMQDWGLVPAEANMGVDNPISRLTAGLIGIKGPWDE